MNLKISLVITLAFLVSFSILYTSNYYHSQSIHSFQSKIEDFYSQDFGTSQSILLLGNSHVGRLNATYIEKILIENNQDLEIYNLSRQGIRYNSYYETQMENTLKLNPKIVILGVGVFDFEKPLILKSNIETISKENQNVNQNVLHQLFEKTEIVTILANPKLNTLEFINSIDEEPLMDPLDRQKTPFFVWKEGMKRIANDWELKRKSEIHPFRGIDEKKRITTLNSLENIIQFYKENQIEVVLFITPASKYFINQISEEDVDISIGEVEKIAKNQEIRFFSLLNKYENSQIFSDPTHVSYHPDGLVYSEDITKIIIQELEQ